MTSGPMALVFLGFTNTHPEILPRILVREDSLHAVYDDLGGDKKHLRKRLPRRPAVEPNIGVPKVPLIPFYCGSGVCTPQINPPHVPVILHGFRTCRFHLHTNGISA